MKFSPDIKGKKGKNRKIQASLTITPTSKSHILHPFINAEIDNIGTNSNYFFLGEVSRGEKEKGFDSEVICVSPGTEMVLADKTVEWDGTIMHIKPDGSATAETGHFISLSYGGIVPQQTFGMSGRVERIPLYKLEAQTPEQNVLGIRFYPTKAGPPPPK